MFISFLKYMVKLLVSLFMAILIYGAIWDEFFFDNLSTLLSGGELYPQLESVNKQPLDYVNPKYDKYEYPWDSGVAFHSLLSFNIVMGEDDLKKIKSSSFIIDSDSNSLVDLGFIWSDDQTDTYLKYFYSYFFNKERHYENTWYSCDESVCRINLQLYNNYLPVHNGQNHDVKIVFRDNLGSIILEKNFLNVYFPLNDDAQSVDYPKVDVTLNSSENRFIASITPMDERSWAIIQWIDSSGRSDESIDLSQYKIGQKLEFKYNYQGDIRYLAALVYSGETLSEYKYEIINKDKI